MKYIARIINGKMQDIKEHSENTARLCASTLQKIGLFSLGFLLGALHDLGKLSEDFQKYILKNDDSLRGSVNHSAAAAEYIYNKFYINESDIFRRLTAQLIIDAVYSHHGRLFDCINTSAENEFSDKMNAHLGCGYMELADIYYNEVMAEERLIELFESSVEEVKTIFSKIKQFSHFGTGMLQKLVYSSLIDADRWDAFCFEAGLDPFMTSMLPWEELAEKMERKARSFIADTPINEMRCRISERCFEFAKRPGGIYRLSVPTGGGKTLSSLRYALQYAKNNNALVSHIFYVIPFRTILDQTADEIRAVCGDDAVLEHHSGVVAEDDNDKAVYERYSILTQRWDKPIVLTTLVQFMNALYIGKSACARRMNALVNSVIIIDEVQSVPKKLISLFNEAINFLAEICNATAVLCTATQPSLENIKYHAIRLSDDFEIVPYDKKMINVFKRAEAVNLTSSVGMTASEIAEFAENTHEKSILIITNTTEQAYEIYENISINCHKIYLSTAKCGEHRRMLISEITESLKSEESKKLIVVSTQLVEAGIDVSFACVIRIMAGIDNLIQAAGRCNRHGEYNRLCKVYLVNFADENLSMLPDIAEAKLCTKLLLAENSERDLLSNESINDYYREYFKIRDTGLNPMNYIVGETTIMELLSGNKLYVNDYKTRRKGESVPLMMQAFKTAGIAFHVIEGNTYTILVPYAEGRNYIEMLQSGIGLQEKYEIIKKCAGFTVNVFEYQLKKLRENYGAYFIEDLGIWCLSEGFYSEEYGVLFKSDSEFMNF